MLLLLNSRAFLCSIARKTREIYSILKSDILCFQVLPSFVPTIFVFSRDLRFYRSRPILNLAALHLFPVTGQDICCAGKLELWVVSQFEVEAALRRHLARQTRRYEFRLRHYRTVCSICAFDI